MNSIDCTRAEELISLAQDGQTNEEEQQALQAHLAQCGPCRLEQALAAKICAAMRAMPPELEPQPGFSGQVMGRITQLEPRRRWAGKMAGWRSGLAAAAAALLITVGSINLFGGWPAALTVRYLAEDNAKGKEVIIADHGQKTKPKAEQAKKDNPAAGKQGAEDNQTPDPQNTQPEQPGAATPKDTGTDPAKAGAPEQRDSAPVVLLSSELTAKSTVLKLAADESTGSRAESIAAAAGGKAALLADQSAEQGRVQIMRVTVPESQATALVNSLAGLGAVTDRQQESRNLTAQYNKLAARYNELAQDHPGAEAELASLQQQMSIIKQDAQNHTVILWLQQK